MIDFPLNTLGLAHKVIADFVRPGNFCIDATAGRGRDTAFLCGLVGESGRVLAFDIQPEAVEATRLRLAEEGFSSIASVVMDSHSNMGVYAAPASVDCVLFNFGWLPGGNHTIFTHPETSIPAIEAALELLRPDGLLSLCLYYGGESGFEERDTLLEYLKTLDSSRFTVLPVPFFNRSGNPPIPVFVLKHG